MNSSQYNIDIPINTEDKITLSFFDNNVEINLPLLFPISQTKYTKIINQIESTLDTKITTEITDKPKNIFENINFIINEIKTYQSSLLREVNVITKIQDEVSIITTIDIEKDISFKLVFNRIELMDDYTFQIHQVAVKCLMKKWKKNMTDINSIINNFNRKITQIKNIIKIVGYSGPIITGITKENSD